MQIVLIFAIDVPFVEYAGFDNFGGAAGERRQYVVGAVEFDYRKYALSFVAAPRGGPGRGGAVGPPI